jgi:hypothetical protein
MAIVGPLIVLALAGAFKHTLDQKLDVRRFEADSIRREEDRMLLRRIDQRVTAIYCADKPPGCQ